MQRLRWIAQLTSADHVFPGGTHNRFIHSLGAMHLAGMYMRNLFRNTKLPNESNPNLKKIWNNKKKYIQIARIAALLHDIGHGPFSHAYDRTIYKDIYGIDDGGHDIHRIIIINVTELEELIKKCGISIKDILQSWNTTNVSDVVGEASMYRLIGAVIQGPLGADRMDFILRDSYFTGTEHLGTISPQRIISNAKIHIQNPNQDHFALHLAYHNKTLSDIIQTLDGRLRMYDGVYLHKTVFSACVLIEEMMNASYTHLNLSERTLDPNKFLLVNDYTIIGEIMASTSSEMAKARYYCQRLLNRQLPKLQKEYRVSSNTKFNPNDYVLPTIDGFIIIRTKDIGPIKGEIFDELGILFYSPDEQMLFTCDYALKKIEYQPPQKSFYYVRIYRVSETDLSI
jgi:hypothetical protein